MVPKSRSSTTPTRSLNLNMLPPQAAERITASDGRGTIIPITLAATGSAEGILKIAESNSIDGFNIAVAGEAAIDDDFRKVAKRDLIQGETIGVGIAIVILLLVFRAVGSTWIPVILAAMGIAIATGAVALIGQFYKSIPFFVTNFITMIGLAVGIDYALFIVARFKEERGKGFAIEGSNSPVRRDGKSSRLLLRHDRRDSPFGHADSTDHHIPGNGARGNSRRRGNCPRLTHLPAGPAEAARRQGLRPGKYRTCGSGRFNGDISLGGFWEWVTRRVLRRPVIHLVVVAAVLIALAVPYFDINIGFNGVETLPDDFRSKGAFTYLQEEFPEALGTLSSVDIVVDGDAASQQVRDGIGVLARSIDLRPRAWANQCLTK